MPNRYVVVFVLVVTLRVNLVIFISTLFGLIGFSMQHVIEERATT